MLKCAPQKVDRFDRAIVIGTVHFRMPLVLINGNNLAGKGSPFLRCTTTEKDENNIDLITATRKATNVQEMPTKVHVRFHNAIRLFVLFRLFIQVPTEASGPGKDTPRGLPKRKHTSLCPGRMLHCDNGTVKKKYKVRGGDKQF